MLLKAVKIENLILLNFVIFSITDAKVASDNNYEQGRRNKYISSNQERKLPQFMRRNK